jgi:hypothetical protein
MTWEGDIDFWIANMSTFDSNNFLTFGLGNTLGSSLMPTNMARLPAPYNAPPNGVANIIDITRPNTNTISQTQFYTDIKSALETKYGVGVWNTLATENRRVQIFVDTSGSMKRSTVTTGMDQFETFLTSEGITWNELNCGNEQWIRWLVNSALNISDCT